MYSFGKRPPQALGVFGVAGVLGEECRVFYDTVFNAQHLGRVCDLLSAKLRKAGVDELRFRAVLLYSVFEGLHAQQWNMSNGSLNEPLVIEVGVDFEKLGVAVSFTLPEGQQLQLDGLSERVRAHTNSNSFEQLLGFLYEHAHRTVVRYQASIRRVEVVALLGFPGNMDDSDLSSTAPLEVVEIGTDSLPAPKAASYVQLGDLDYAALLHFDPNAGKPAVPATGEVLTQFADREEGALSSSTENTELADALVTKIAGGTDKPESQVTRLTGQTPPDFDNTERTLAASSSADAAGASVLGSEQAKLYQDQIAELQRKIAELEMERNNTATRISSQSVAEVLGAEMASESENSGLGGMLRKLWPFGKPKSQDSAAVAGSPGAVAGQPGPAQAQSQPSQAVVAAPTSEAPVSLTPSSTETAANSLVNEIQAGNLSKIVNKVQREAMDIQKELGSAKAKRWVDGFMGELVMEKARLHDMAKKLSSSVRQKENEFKTKERALTEELHRRDDLLKQKNFALQRLKDQLAQVTLTVEKVKESAKASSVEENGYKSKYNYSQKLLGAAKDESKELQKRITELKNQLSSAQMAAAINKGPSHAEHTALQNKYETAKRQLDEFKRQNQQLMDRINDQKKDQSKLATAGSLEETKKRLEQAMKLVASGKKETERLGLKVDEMLREEDRLKRELEVTQRELKTLKARTGASGSGSAA